jgi:GT2 family glycosyltransferase
MDYNVRAARAGFRCVWLGGIYVHRAPFTARRAGEEVRRFEASKRRYQDKFCGRRLQGERGAYLSHCRGDACPNFAPTVQTLAGSPAASLPAATVTLPVIGAASSVGPLVSCIMPTFNRRAHVPQAVRCFLRQDDLRAELVVVDDGTDPIADLLPDDPRIRYVRLDRRLTIGAKRNLACEHALGEMIAHWDDDWYPPWQLRVQAAALRDHSAEVCGSSQLYYYEPGNGRSWRYRYTGRPGTWVAGNTLAYLRTYWSRNPFPNVQVGEDTRFLMGGQAPGAVRPGKPRVVCGHDPRRQQ